MYGKDQTIFKVTNLGSGIDDVTSGYGVLCFSIVKQCNSLSKFCYGGDCTFAIMDDRNQCCPGGRL